MTIFSESVFKTIKHIMIDKSMSEALHRKKSTFNFFVVLNTIYFKQICEMLLENTVNMQRKNSVLDMSFIFLRQG